MTDDKKLREFCDVVLRFLAERDYSFEFDGSNGPVLTLSANHCIDEEPLMELNTIIDEMNIEYSLHNDFSRDVEYNLVMTWFPNDSTIKEILLVLEDCSMGDNILKNVVYIRNQSGVNFVPLLFSNAISLDDYQVMWNIPTHGRENAPPIIDRIVKEVGKLPYRFSHMCILLRYEPYKVI